MPKASSWEELNDFLLEAAQKDEQRSIAGRTQTVAAGMNLEREHLRCPHQGGIRLGRGVPHVNASGCVKVLFYSVPLPVGVEVQAKVHSAYLEIWHQGQRVVRHERCFDRQQKILNFWRLPAAGGTGVWTFVKSSIRPVPASNFTCTRWPSMPYTDALIALKSML